MWKSVFINENNTKSIIKNKKKGKDLPSPMRRKQANERTMR